MSDIIIDRDYIDNYAVKEFIVDGMIEKYFPDIDVNLRTVGMIGYTSELISNTCEDTFNTGSVLFRESFPNRAQIDESIYSHAAIFQLDDMFSSASSCKFLIVLDEAAIIKNMESNKDSNNKNMFYFYVDKNTTIYVEDIPFTIDYDIMMTIVRRTTEIGDEYLYTARYLVEEYSNTLSSIEDPYVKIRRSTDGFIALEVQTHQCIRDIIEEKIISNSEINYPVVDITYDGKMAGFDVLYKSPSSNNYTQLQTLISFSQPLKQPFCYYQRISSNLLRISFNTKDTYFMPEFNSELKIIVYNTSGDKGNFDTYKGTNVSIIQNNDNYVYTDAYLLAAQPIGAAEGGKDEQTLDALQDLSIEGYRTANALTTDKDLQEYFNNYKHRYGNADILFIKKRDDIYERIFSAFMIIKNNDFIYKTNTLNLKMNLYDMNINEKDVYIIEPGTVFTCNNDSGYAEFFRDKHKTAEYLELYNEAVKKGQAPFLDDPNLSVIPDYLNRPCSFAQWKTRKKYDDKKNVWDLTDEEYELYDNPHDNKFLIINPFLIKFTKSPNYVSTYMTYVDNSVSVDFTETNDDMFVQFIMYTLNVQRKFTKEKKYDIWCKIAPTISIDANKNPLIKVDYIEEDTKIIHYRLNDRYSLNENDLRVMLCIMDGTDMICYTEMIPTDYDSLTDNFTFSASIYTDDYITSTNELRLLSGRIYRDDTTGNYYKVYENDNTLYYKYDVNDNIIEERVSVDTVTSLAQNGKLIVYDDVVNNFIYDDILIPSGEVTVKIYILYKRNYSEIEQGLVENLESSTNHPFMQATRYNKYIWTNEYSTSSSPVVFIKSLDNVRTYLDFLDYTAAGYDENGNVAFTYDIMDLEMKTIPFLRASTIQDDDVTDYFFNIFYNHYKFLENIIDTKLRNETGIDMKFYNTYGRSKNYLIGEDGEIIDSVNLSISFDIWFVNGTDVLSVVPEVKLYIKELIETLSYNGSNSIFISNIMRKVEQKFAYVDHMRFNQINKYDSSYQAVKSSTNDISELSVEDRRWYIPEMLVCDLDDIDIVDYVITT